MTDRRPTRVLLIEDEPADIEFTEYAFAQGDLEHQLIVCRTGTDAVGHIRSTQNTTEFPDLVLLDVNLPDMTGMDVVEAIRADPESRDLPIIMLSTSNYHVDVRAAYACGANAFVQKPLRLQSFEDLVRSIEQFWFNQALLPNSNQD